MEEYSSPENILPIFYSLLFVFSFMCFTTCCGYLQKVWMWRKRKTNQSISSWFEYI